MEIVGNFTCFWGKEDVFSQWHRSVFQYKGITFVSGEQFMMYCKAKLFGDEAMAQAILLEDNPEKNKKQGRCVKNFDVSVWEEKCLHYVYVGNREKFLQNPDMFEILLSTEGTELVEASPYDRIWGVGLSYKDPRIKDKSQWRGTNWLGKILTQLRDDLLLRIERGEHLVLRREAEQGVGNRTTKSGI